MAPKRDWKKSNVTIEDTTVRKFGDVYRLQREIEAMEYVRTKTSLPIPKVLASQFYYNDPHEDSWMLTERHPGLNLGDAWAQLSDQAKEKATSQLKSYLAELHSLHPESPGWIGSCSHGPAYDHRIDNMRTHGPWDTVAGFNDFLVKPILDCPFPENAAKYRPMLPDDAEINFAHADLNPENILVDPNTGVITAIIDWEMAGYWPEWWEYRKALYGPRWWIQLAKKIMWQYSAAGEADMDIEMF